MIYYELQCVKTCQEESLAKAYVSIGMDVLSKRLGQTTGDSIQFHVLTTLFHGFLTSVDTKGPDEQQQTHPN